ncbi:MAG: bifunctional pyr operon transcriptional regulator/uracil phosphoribosyltransferase PyrR [Deltaproteobacteria bacterium]|nr:bifunctional pyr operon transcriptional regulator/uracil phosphoribosyltransferase PyrR [Deltaproteobacteria bacterium]
MRQLIKAAEFTGVITGLAAKIAEHETDYDNVAFVGIHTRGIPLSNRLVKIFHGQGKNVLEGMLDINLYRDDLSETSDKPVLKETKIEFDINGKIIYLVDDVLYTGRTIRAAMDAIFDLGRPKAVHLVVMAKRNGRELPIDTDLVGINVKTQPTDNVKVKFVETDNKDDVTVLEDGEY